MNFAELFIKRPVMTALVMIGILLFGVQGYRALPVSDLPNIDFPTLQVQAGLPGASPETMASSVAAPLERHFSGCQKAAARYARPAVDSKGQPHRSAHFAVRDKFCHASVDYGG